MAEVASPPAAPAGMQNGAAAAAAVQASAAQSAATASALQGRPGDALDSPDFDAVKFLNEMFPTGEAHSSKLQTGCPAARKQMAAKNSVPGARPT